MSAYRPARPPLCHTKLVALRVGQRDPTLWALTGFPEPAGAEADEPLDLGVTLLLAHVDVQMHPVLHSLHLRHDLEQQPGSHALGVTAGGGRLPREAAVDLGHVVLGGD